VKILGVGTILVGVMFMNSFSFASSDEKLQTLHTQDFIEWQKLSDEEKENTLMPKMYTTTLDDSVLEEYSQKQIRYRVQILTRKISKTLYSAMTKSATYNVPAYNLTSDIGVQVKHQGSTNECWAFSTVTMLETNLALTKNVNKTFSPRHMDYSSVKTFTDGINEYAYNREAGDGGLATFGLAYLTNGKGAVLESDMPFEDNEEKISLKSLEKNVDTIVSEYVALPTLHKEYNEETGAVTYTNGGTGSNKQVYTDEEVTQIRNMIKNHIVKYGAVSSVTAGNQAEFYSNPTSPFKSKAYFCNTNAYSRDHAVTIVGWDDTYSKDNFTGKAKPTTNGAYICLNTYGTQSFDNGYIYISYEDALIESLLYGIKDTSDVDYDNLYQYNLTGDNTALGVTTKSEGYIGTIFSRDDSVKENLTYVGVSIPDNVSLEIYVNPNGNSTSISSLKKIATTDVLEAGYHRIKVDETKLTGDCFAIVVKEISDEGRFYFSIEASVPNSIYSTITGNPGKNYYSFDGYTWKNLSDENISAFDMKNTDLCIKAFTDVKEEEDPTENEEITLTSTDYSVKESDIYLIKYATTFKDFKSKIATNSTSIVVKDKDGKEIKDTDYIKTGMKLVLSNDKEYSLIVRGDITCSGTVELLDFSKMLSHYCYGKEFTLTGDSLKAADMNADSKIDLTDISQMVVLYMDIK
jgi:C1A family cysteine protease